LGFFPDSWDEAKIIDEVDMRLKIIRERYLISLMEMNITAFSMMVRLKYIFI